MAVKKIGGALTSYDFLKAFAVIFMIADHVGFYFFPEDTWWRVAGRLCVPVWFFLIGYARSRDTGLRLWIGAALLAAGGMTVGMSVFPLNVLATMIIVRVILDPLMGAISRSRLLFWAACVFMALLALPTEEIFEYGTQAILMAMVGWLARRRDEWELPRQTREQYFIFALTSFLVVQFIHFGFDSTQFTILCFGILGVIGGLLYFKPRTYPRLTARLPRSVVFLFQVMGRRTLEIYVTHLLLFKALGLMLFPDRFQLFHWTWL